MLLVGPLDFDRGDHTVSVIVPPNGFKSPCGWGIFWLAHGGGAYERIPLKRGQAHCKVGLNVGVQYPAPVLVADQKIIRWTGDGVTRVKLRTLGRNRKTIGLSDVIFGFDSRSAGRTKIGAGKVCDQDAVLHL